jgi:hypothetical protein
MAWAKIDDGWWAHPKVMVLSLAASGLWARALSWSCHQRKDVIPPRFLDMVEADTSHADELVEVGLWHPVDGGWLIHEWDQYQGQSLSEKRADAGRKGGKRSGEARRNEASGKQKKQTDEANDEAGALPVPSLPDQDLNPSPPGSGRDSGETDADDPLTDDASDEIARQFDEYFWPVYPSTNGRKPEKGKALTQWRKLAVEQRRRAVIGARNLARSDTVPKYAHRFLRKDTSGEFPFDDWQQREGGGPEPIAPDACQQCGQGKADHDDQLCSILAEAS